MQIQLRRVQSNLVNAGTGVILFAMWSIIRSILYVTSGEMNAEMELEDFSDAAISPATAKIITYSVMIIITAIDMLLRARIARNAIAEGKGEPKMKKRRRKALSGQGTIGSAADGSYDPTAGRRNGHLILAVFLLILYVGLTVFDAGTLTGLLNIRAEVSYMDSFLSIIVNLTSMYILFLILRSTGQVRSLTRRIYKMKMNQTDVGIEPTPGLN